MFTNQLARSPESTDGACGNGLVTEAREQWTASPVGAHHRVEQHIGNSADPFGVDVGQRRRQAGNGRLVACREQLGAAAFRTARLVHRADHGRLENGKGRDDDSGFGLAEQRGATGDIAFEEVEAQSPEAGTRSFAPHRVHRDWFDGIAQPPSG